MTKKIMTGADLAGACEGEQIADLIDLARRVIDARPENLQSLRHGAHNILAEIEHRAAIQADLTGRHTTTAPDCGKGCASLRQHQERNEERAAWYVRCRVSGGVTGTREAILKAANGVERVFETREAAEAEARRLMTARNGDPFRTADFQYWAEAR